MKLTAKGPVTISVDAQAPTMRQTVEGDFKLPNTGSQKAKNFLIGRFGSEKVTQPDLLKKAIDDLSGGEAREALTKITEFIVTDTEL